MPVITKSIMYRIIPVDQSNLADHPQAICFINPKHPTYRLKSEWLIDRFREGLKIKLIYAEGEKRPAGFIEYVPGEQCWRAVSAPNYIFIHCIWINAVKHRDKGLGTMLLNECIKDAEQAGFAGVAAVTSPGAFMAGRSLFVKNGFTVAGKTATDQELMVKQLRPGPIPVFNDWQSELSKYEGLHMVYSRQCPWVARFVEETGRSMIKKGLDLQITELTTPKQAQFAPSPYSVFNLIHNGKLLADHYISETRFMNILKKEKLWSFLLLLFLSVFHLTLFSQTRSTGIVSGRVVDAQTQKPVEYANMVLLDSLTGKIVTGIVSDSNGYFRMANVPFGTYVLEYSFIGYKKQHSRPIAINRKNLKVNLGTLSLVPASITMDDVTITAEKSMMINKIDRKVFNVQKDIQAQTGTVTDVLQTIPSVSVDMDGNISLRGSENVTILINGRPSVLSGVANLEQMPASLVEKIEVITNPSARYRPDGTAGIINIIMKKEREAGFNGILGANVGNNDRYNTNLQLNINTGKMNLFGSYGFRQDYRHRSWKLNSQTIDTVTKQSTWLFQGSDSHARPRSHLAQLGFDWAISKRDAAGITGIYNTRVFKRNDTTANLYQDNELVATEVFTRYHDGKENENTIGLNWFYKHVFDKEEDHQLQAGFEYERDHEYEVDYYTNVYSLPDQPEELDRAVVDNMDYNINVTLDYSRPLWEDASMETGYEGDIQIIGKDEDVSHPGPASGQWIVDPEEGNKFHSNQTVHALFAIVSCGWKKFSVMAGLRAEETLLNLDFKTLDTTTKNDYFALYPTLHLSYKTGKNEWQLNYSRRVNRPDGDDMNPVPEYRDPRNIFVGNLDLKPEDIHSLEFGYAINSENINFVPTLFYRQKTNGFTFVTSSLNDSVLVTTIDNLAKDMSAGLDLSGTAQITKIIDLNFSASGFYNQIDASNIGYSSAKSTFSWNAKLNASFSITKTTLFQVIGQYRSEVLTSQGFRRPTGVVNLGFRQDLWKKKLSLIATVSDLFNTQIIMTSISTSTLVQEATRHRDARVFYGGIVFNFGTNGKKPKESKFEFDTGE